MIIKVQLKSFFFVSTETLNIKNIPFCLFFNCNEIIIIIKNRYEPGKSYNEVDCFFYYFVIKTRKQIGH